MKLAFFKIAGKSVRVHKFVDTIFSIHNCDSSKRQCLVFNEAKYSQLQPVYFLMG